MPPTDLHAQNVGRRVLTFDNGRHEDVYAVAVDHVSGRWEQIWVLRDSAMADRVADALNRAAAPATPPTDDLSAAKVRAEFQRFYDYVAEADIAIVDAWHFDENVRAARLSAAETTEP